MTDSHSQHANYSRQLDFIQHQLFSLQTQVQHIDVYMKTHFQQVKSSLDHLTTGMGLLYSMIKKINSTTVAERTFFEDGSGGGGGSVGEGGGSGSGSGSGSGNDDKSKGKEDPIAGRAKSVEDSSTKEEKPQDKQQEESGSGRDKGQKTQGEIRRRESK